ncbi:hypothetical protein K402DRAFT_463533 [Aulographum hederae CBS 113979]|uniref:Uncharacterized protein n=1 Tax=Aulographum hederae CBS 113979 TaxID=1176131 RepID=A0A6G1H0U3_9PEZI|nr:hypothetical protein K402DRAFT_463533 [Aulographum hederae CBS 113979]
MQLIQVSAMLFAACVTAAHNHYGHHAQVARHGHYIRNYGNASAIMSESSSDVVSSTPVLDSMVSYLTAGSSSAVESSAVETAYPTSAPVGTGVYSSAVVSTTPEAITEGPSSVVTEVSTAVLTYTIGTGSSKSVVTTTVKHTSTKTIVQTVYATRPASATAEAAASASVEDSTTTYYLTSTMTRYHTVYPAGASQAGDESAPATYPTEGASTESNGESGSVSGSSGSGSGSESGSGSGSGMGSNEGESCAPMAPVTVTVTEHGTVTVTATPTPSSSDAVLAENTGAPYGNGTEATITSSSASTGFLTSYSPMPSGYTGN